MEFVFPYRVRPENLTILALVNVYRSMAGVVNIVFTVSMILVAYRFWAEISLPLRALVAAGILLFPLFQPLVIYGRSKRIVSRMPADMEMRIDGKGIAVTAGSQNSRIGFSELNSVTRIRGMLILYTRSKQGFILNRETLGDKEKELYGFLARQAGFRQGKGTKQGRSSSSRK